MRIRTATQGVAFYLRGTAHAVQCLVAIDSLRRWWQGPVALLTDEGEDTLSGAILREPALNLQRAELPLCQQRRNSCLITKTWLYRYTPFDCTLFLDADTFTCGPFFDVWPSDEEEVTWTAFSDWRTIHSPYQARVERAAQYAPAEVERCLALNPAAINTGVFCFWRDAAALPAIHELAKQLHPIFIPDEIAAHLLYSHYPHKLVDDRFNSSPRHGRHQRDEQIVHCHGGKVLSPRVRRRWLTLFVSCWQRNLAGVTAWSAASAELANYLTAAREEGFAV